MRIGLDLDGVLFEFEQHFLKHFNLPRHSATSWDDKRFIDNFHRIVDDLDFWLTIPPIFDPKKLVFKPEVYVTARPVDTWVSVEALQRCRFPEAEVITVGVENSKVDALRDRVDVFLDDAYHNYTDLNENGIRCLLVTRGHNKSYDVGTDRVDSLLEFQNSYLLKQELV